MKPICRSDGLHQWFMQCHTRSILKDYLNIPDQSVIVNNQSVYRKISHYSS